MKKINFLTYRKSLNRDTLNNRGWKNSNPLLTFDIIIITDIFSFSNDKKKLRKVVKSKMKNIKVTYLR